MKERDVFYSFSHVVEITVDGLLLAFALRSVEITVDGLLLLVVLALPVVKLQEHWFLLLLLLLLLLLVLRVVEITVDVYIFVHIVLLKLQVEWLPLLVFRVVNYSRRVTSS